MPFQQANDAQSTECFANPVYSFTLLILPPSMLCWLNMVTASDAKIY
ncbi:MAG: hypothetical protein KGH88_04465 [Thaumarchaeota archaeon]|nr:hypothetical protein [Nitrososphaerota archaeon]